MLFRKTCIYLVARNDRDKKKAHLYQMGLTTLRKSIFRYQVEG
jgi:hypothetical protein